MAKNTVIKIDLILHATEDFQKIAEPLSDLLGIEIDEKYYDESLDNLKRMYLRYEKQKWI